MNEKQRESTGGCMTCAFVDSNPMASGSQVCRRFPPKSVAINGPQGLGFMQVFSVVKLGDWCGEFEPQDLMTEKEVLETEKRLLIKPSDD